MPILGRQNTGVYFLINTEYQLYLFAGIVKNTNWLFCCAISTKFHAGF